MQSPTPPRTAATVAVVLWLPLLAGLLVGWVADRSLLGALVLMGEPLLAVLAAWGVISLLAARRWTLAAAALVGCAGGLAALHLPASPTPPPVQRPAWATALRACAAASEPVERALHLAQWALPDGSRPEEADLAELGDAADLVLLHGAATPEAGAILAARMDGASRYYPPSATGEGGMTLVVRGSFQRCGDDAQDAWAVDLPAAEGHSARGVVTFPRVEGVGLFPLVVVQMDPMHGPRSWPSWPARLDGSGQRLAAVVQAIDASRVVLVGDLGVPPSFRHLAGRLRGAGLTELPGPPSWPTRLGPLPFLPLHRLDRVWSGSAWVAGGARALPDQGRQRAPVLTRLLPDTMTARAGPGR